ncbi:unnamed protein product, partial [Mesorhabditis belari]|uniref:ACB domain-containing protein n=1 Tax=Mesorhabditis belari TaxID=2138241 RepID=A0AAF3FKU2_9BILA
MTLEEKFQAAVDIIQKLPKDGPLSTTNDDKLKFYSLFKQATVGDVNTERPAFYQLIEKAKWDAWKSVEGISKEDAMQKYIDAVNAAFEKAAEQVDVNAWLSGDGLDPSIKTNLAKINAK